MLHKSFFSKTAVSGIAIALFLAGCDKEEEKKVALSSIEVTPAQVELTVGGTPQQLTAKAVPEDASDVTFVWSSANNAVATVSETGLVTAVSAGNTTVKVAGSGIEKSVPVTVLPVPVTPEIAVTPATPDQVSATGGALEFAVAASADWTYSLSANAGDWLTEATKTAAALTLTVAPNTATEARNATVTFSLTGYPEVTQEVTVSQAAGIIAGMNEEDFGPGVTPAVLTATAANLKSTLEGITTAGNYVVNITEDATLNAAADNSVNITLGTAGAIISLRGSGNNIISPAHDANIVRIREGKLILRDITLSKTGPKMSTVAVGAGGQLVIHEGVSIVGSGDATNSGVRVEGGQFLMKGGEIHGHRGPAGFGPAGVLISTNGVFQMDGGKIYDNRSGYAGGIFIMDVGSRFIMNGGELYDNHSTDAAEGGGAVYIWQSGRVEVHSGAIIYGKDGGDGKAGNTAPQNGDTYGHAVTAFYNGSHGKYRSTTIQNETLSITLSGGAETESTGAWVGF